MIEADISFAVRHVRERRHVNKQMFIYTEWYKEAKRLGREITFTGHGRIIILNQRKPVFTRETPFHFVIPVDAVAA